MPDYRITIHFKVDKKPATGIRHWPYYDLEGAKKHFEILVYKSYGRFNIDSIEVTMIPDKGYEPVIE